MEIDVSDIRFKKLTQREKVCCRLMIMLIALVLPAKYSHQWEKVVAGIFSDFEE